MKLHILVGPPGCGKSYYAKKTASTYINQDSQGKVEHLHRFLEAVKKGEDIIVDRMNFDREQRKRYIEPAKVNGYDVVIYVFHLPRKLCIERCIARKDHETIKDEVSARKAINFFFSRYQEPTTDEGEIIFINPEEERRPAIICDLDGTLCNIEHRKHLVQRAIDKTKEGKPNWPAFFRAMANDKVNEWCAELLRHHHISYDIVFCSGRPEEYREVTEKWLKAHNLYFGHLFMRSSSDYRQDNIVKEIILNFDVLTQFKPLFAIDDRQQVVDMWRKNGIVCLQCAEGDF
jgi:predicted kinase